MRPPQVKKQRYPLLPVRSSCLGVGFISLKCVRTGIYWNSEGMAE